MKLKKIGISTISFLLLTAFVGCISLEILFSSPDHQHTLKEFSTHKTNGPDFTFLFEEDEDNDDSDDFVFFLNSCDLHKLITIELRNFSVSLYKITGSFLSLKNPLFILNRVIRL